MLIASIIHPKRSPRRRVELFGILYEFLPKTDKAGQTHYVADVSAEAAACLLERDNYYKFGHGQPALTRAQPAEPEAQAETKAKEYPCNILAEAQALVSVSAAKIGSATANVSHLDVVRCALEQESKAEKPRNSVLKLLESTLEGAAQAGVTD